MEYVILGLLMIRERTLYEIKKVLEEKISLFYSASFGSISSAISNMLAKEWIVVREQVTNGRNKKVYTLTALGQAAFEAWLGSDIPKEKVKDSALTRLFFMGYLSAQQRISIITNYIATLTEQAALLELLKKQAELELVNTHHQQLAAFQIQTLQYGIDYYAFSSSWFKRLLATIEEQDGDYKH